MYIYIYIYIYDCASVRVETLNRSSGILVPRPLESPEAARIWAEPSELRRRTYCLGILKDSFGHRASVGRMLQGFFEAKALGFLGVWASGLFRYFFKIPEHHEVEILEPSAVSPPYVLFGSVFVFW